VDGSAEQNVPLINAVADLTRGLSTDRNTSQYPAAISHLRDLATLPDSDVTPAQRRQGNTDVTFLDTFFGTPGLWGPGGLCADGACN